MVTKLKKNSCNNVVAQHDSHSLLGHPYSVFKYCIPKILGNINYMHILMMCALTSVTTPVQSEIIYHCVIPLAASILHDL